MASEKLQRQRHLQKRRSTLNCLAFISQGVEETKTFPFCQESTVKAWKSMEDLDSPDIQVKCPIADERPKQQQSINININIGGKVFHIPKQAAMHYPQTRIGALAHCSDRAKLFRLCDDYSMHTNEFFFDRDPAFFHYIAHFYTSGVLWIVTEMCPIHFEEEIEYWGLSLKDTQRCCQMMFEEKADDLRDYLKVERELLAEIEVKHDDDGYKDMFLGDVRKILWNTVENPYTSIWAKAFTVFSNLFVLISIVALTLSSVEEMNIYMIYGKTYMEWVESFSIVFFSFEYFLRLGTTSNVKPFLKSALNFVDFMALMPYFIQIVFEVFTNTEDVSDLGTMAQVSKLSQVLKVVKLMRILRILKLARHSTGMRAFGFTLRQCYQQVCCLFLFIAMGIFTFSALLHSVEREVEGSPFSSIPDAWWWATVSISTVGYGDVVPVSVLGRMVAFACISFGIILNGMPISILFNKFSDYYEKLKAQEYTSASVQRRFQLKKRLRHKMDVCFHPSVEDDSRDSPH